MFFKHDDDKDIMKKGARNALAAFVYVSAVVAFMSSLQNPDSPDSLGFLMLFVLSAAVMGVLVFGSPVMLYVDGKKKEAVRLVGWTIASLAAITLCVLVVMTSVAARA